MSETIPPAMTPGEWKGGVAHLDPMSGLQVVFADGSILFELGDLPGIEVRGDEALMAVIAAALSQLSTSHPARYSRRLVESLRLLADAFDGLAYHGDVARVRRHAEALEQCLPPG